MRARLSTFPGLAGHHAGLLAKLIPLIVLGLAVLPLLLFLHPHHQTRNASILPLTEVKTRQEFIDLTKVYTQAELKREGSQDASSIKVEQGQN